MGEKMLLTYYHHSGFSVASGDILLIFDYWQGKTRQLPEQLRITPEQLTGYNEVYVFISHGHEDHFDEVVYTWQLYAPVTYIISDDMPMTANGQRMGPGGVLNISDRLKVKAFGSTDSGVSYLVTLDGATFFHAGDLNFWHWREVSTARQIEMADEDFRQEVGPIQGNDIDVAFFPVDPRLGMHFDAGANYFMMTVKPRLLIPMHFWGRSEVIEEYARRARSRDTEVMAMTTQGQSVELVFDEEGYMNINMLALPVLEKRSDATQSAVSLEGYEGADPFHETDLPVDMK